VSKTGWSARVMWIAALLVPPGALAVVWRELMIRHPVIAAVLVVLYEILVAVVGFLAGVAGDIAARWQTRLADRLDGFLRQRMSRFDARYRSFVLAALRFVDHKGLATVGPFIPEMDEVFVDVNVVSQVPHKISPGLLTGIPGGNRGRRSLGDFLDHADPVVLAVIGGPGSGKTTLLRQVARQACLHPRTRRRSLPVLLYLRDHAAAIIANPGAGLTELLRGTLGGIRAEPEGWFDQRLRSGECVVLLDGLDEVARHDDRAKVAAWVERQIRVYPSSDFVISSRPHGYSAAGIDAADVLQVCAFTPEQVNRFVHAWYLAVERHGTESGKELTARHSRESAHDLLRRLDAAPALRDLTANPLLLTMIANVHQYRGALPGSRAELYAEISQVMLWRRQEAKNLTAGLAGSKKETVLRGLGFFMMQQRVSDIGREDLLREVRPILRRLSHQARAEDFLADTESNGLLIERESELYCFAHHTFQEYFAALHIRDKGMGAVLEGTVGDPWWRETTLLYAASTDADSIVSACLEEGTVPALALAFDCADQGSELAAELLARLEDLLASATRPETTPERRKLIAGVLITRHTQHHLRTGSGVRVSTQPVTAELYRLFLADTEIPPPDCPLPADGGTTVGMRADDATAFANWASTLTGAGASCRLPSRALMADPDVRKILDSSLPGQAALSFWVQPDDGAAAIPSPAVPVLWVPPHRRHPREVDTAEVAGCTGSDVTGAGPTLTRLLLLRSAVGIRLLAVDLDRALAHARARDLALARVRAHDRDHHLVRDRANALALNSARTLAHSLARKLAHDLTFDRDRDLDADLAHGLALDVARELARHLDFALDVASITVPDLAVEGDGDLGAALASNLTRALDSARALARARTLDQDLARDPDPERDFARALELAGTVADERDPDTDPDHDSACAHIMGYGLSRSLETTISRTREPASWPARFAQALMTASGVTQGSISIRLETAAGRLDEAAGLLKTIRASANGSNPSIWSEAVAERLVQNATRLFTRQEQLTDSLAAAVRLASLCLAAEADSLGQPALGDTYRETAAASTLLQERASGNRPATEAILLVTD
jgi:NACHT domain